MPAGASRAKADLTSSSTRVRVRGGRVQALQNRGQLRQAPRAGVGQRLGFGLQSIAARFELDQAAHERLGAVTADVLELFDGVLEPFALGLELRKFLPVLLALLGIRLPSEERRRFDQHRARRRVQLFDGSELLQSLPTIPIWLALTAALPRDWTAAACA